MQLDTLIQQAATHLNAANSIAVLTGAGVSRESGVPTYRDAMEGLWAQYDPQQLATPQAFRANPKLVWDWYAYRREMMRNAQPNPGHVALTELQKRKPTTRIITQNIDSLHEYAGSTNVLHLHGQLAKTKCSANCQGDPTPLDDATLQPGDENTPPACPHCGAPARPDIVWFNEMLNAEVLDHAAEISMTADVMLVIGTSGIVMPAAALPGVAQKHGAMLIEINPDQSAITPSANLHLAGPSGVVLPLLVEAMD